MAYNYSNISGTHKTWFKRKKEMWDIYPDTKQYREILKTVKKSPLNPKYARRDYLVFVVMGNLGLRIGEMVLLRREHFESLTNDPPIARVPALKKRGKQESYKSIYVHWKVADVIKKYIAKDLYRTDEFLFPGMTETGNLSSRHMYTIIISYFKKCGFTENYTPHSIRHMVGTRIYEKTGDVAFVRDQLGHSVIGNIGATNIYIHTSQERAKTNLKKIGYLL